MTLFAYHFKMVVGGPRPSWRGACMRKLSDLKIGVRLSLGFGLLIVMMLGMALVSGLRFGQVREVNQRLVEVDWLKVEAIHAVDVGTRANARRTMELVISTEAAQRAHIRERIEVNKRSISEALATLDRLIYRPEGRALLQDLKAARERYVASFSKVSQLVDSGQRDEAVALLQRETLPALDALQAPVNGLNTLQKKIAEESAQEVLAASTQSRLLMALLAGLGLVTGLGLAWGLTRGITQPIGEAVQLAQRVAGGDLSAHIKVSRHDEAGQLLLALRDMSESLQQVVSQVRSRTDAMATATRQIAAGNLDLSSRTEEQASALEQTAASMEQLTAAVRQNDDSGQRAHQLADSAAGVAVQGGQVVAEVIRTMEAIDQSSNRIADIIGVVDGIAFQTNLLALNAAVEAARAGEQGRGFAVVASEVRQLAGRAAEAAREIRQLIDTSVGHVRTGSAQVERAGSTLDETVVSVRRVADLMREISLASREQSAGIDQVSQAVGQMDQVTQQNAALVEEAAAATQSLEQQALSLSSTVAFFKLN